MRQPADLESRGDDFPYILQGGLRPRPAARGSLRSPCSPANTTATPRSDLSSDARTSDDAALRQLRASREAGSRGTPPAAVRRPHDVTSRIE